MKILIFGAGNLILSDEGFGVHFVRYLEENYLFPPEVELYDGGTMGIMVTHKFEEADRVYIVDTVAVEGAPGDICRFEKDDFMLKRIPLKMSPHQIGIQEMLLISELRGKCPERITLLGIIPDTLEPGGELSWLLRDRVCYLASKLLKELRDEGVRVTVKAGTDGRPAAELAA
ncbi:MAG TPA: HyaD/HybD family hydrogenase maturation endopeptidase [Geobacteraceae bacterium]